MWSLGLVLTFNRRWHDHGYPTDGTIVVVVSGSGRARILGVAFALKQRDTFVVALWSSLEIQACGKLALFACSDHAAQEKPGLWRESKA